MGHESVLPPRFQIQTLLGAIKLWTDSSKNARNVEKELKLNEIRGDWTRYRYRHITLKLMPFKWYSAYKTIKFETTTEIMNFYQKDGGKKTTLNHYKL